jgi:hypothetical protein
MRDEKDHGNRLRERVQIDLPTAAEPAWLQALRVLLWRGEV